MSKFHDITQDNSKTRAVFVFTYDVDFKHKTTHI
jgi:hypothetical protein